MPDELSPRSLPAVCSLFGTHLVIMGGFNENYDYSGDVVLIDTRNMSSSKVLDNSGLEFVCWSSSYQVCYDAISLVEGKDRKGYFIDYNIDENKLRFM